jgi:hypothetical protein
MMKVSKEERQMILEHRRNQRRPRANPPRTGVQTVVTNVIRAAGPVSRAPLNVQLAATGLKKGAISSTFSNLKGTNWFDVTRSTITLKPGTAKQNYYRRKVLSETLGKAKNGA